MLWAQARSGVCLAPGELGIAAELLEHRVVRELDERLTGWASASRPLVTVGLAMVILRERLTRGQWAGVALAVGSVVVIVL